MEFFKPSIYPSTLNAPFFLHLPSFLPATLENNSPFLPSIPEVIIYAVQILTSLWSHLFFRNRLTAEDYAHQTRHPQPALHLEICGEEDEANHSAGNTKGSQEEDAGAARPSPAYLVMGEIS